MSAILYANNATTTIAGSINNITTTIALAPGAGALFPAVGAGQFFMGTLTDAATGLVNEIVKVTARSSDTLTVLRGQEGTSAQAWQAGDNFSNLVTAGSLGNYATFSTYAGNPNGAITSGKVGEQVWDSTNQLLWIASSAGVNNTWQAQTYKNKQVGPTTVTTGAGMTTIATLTTSGLYMVSGDDANSNAFVDLVPFRQFMTTAIPASGQIGTPGTRAYRGQPGFGGNFQMSITGAAFASCNVTVELIGPFGW